VIALSLIDHARGDTRRAIARVQEILPAIRNSCDRQLLIWGLTSLASFLIALDDLLGVEAATREVIALLAKSNPEDASIGTAIAYLACVYALRGETVRAATLDGYVETAIRKPNHPDGRKAKEHLSEVLRGRLTPDERGRLAEQGAVLTVDAAIALALTERPASDGELHKTLSSNKTA
jgi:hypothetical protein